MTNSERAQHAIDEIALSLGERKGSWEKYREIIEAAITEAQQEALERAARVVLEAIPSIEAGSLSEPDESGLRSTDVMGFQIQIAEQIRALKID